MCRWLAYTGAPVLLTDVLYTPVHSLIDQSLHSRLGTETTNGDGFGVGWYDAAPAPGVFRSIEPAWNDQNLRELVGPRQFSPALRAHPRGDRMVWQNASMPSATACSSRRCSATASSWRCWAGWRGGGPVLPACA